MFGLAGGTGRQVSSISANLSLYRIVITSPRRLQNYSGCSKRLSSKAAADERTGGVPSGYVEDAFEAKTLLTDFFSSLLVEPHMGPELIVVK